MFWNRLEKAASSTHIVQFQNYTYIKIYIQSKTEINILVESLREHNNIIIKQLVTFIFKMGKSHLTESNVQQWCQRECNAVA